MPTVLWLGPYRFFFYAGDRDEPPHIHVERDEAEAKFWLDPVRLQGSSGFRRPELRRLLRTVQVRREEFLKRWHEYFHG